MIFSKLSYKFFVTLALTAALPQHLAAFDAADVAGAGVNDGGADDQLVQLQNLHEDRNLLDATTTAANTTTTNTTTTKTKTYLVTFTDETMPPAERCAALAASNGGSVLHVYDHVLNGCALKLPVAQQAQAQAAFTTLSNSPGVLGVEFDQKVYASQSSSSPPPTTTPSPESSEHDNIFGTAAVATTWGLDRINQCALPLNGQMTKQDAAGVKVFIVDTGVRSDHVEFANGVISSENCHFSAISGEAALSDGNGHGTHVAGTTCGAQYGVSANCKVCSVKVLSNSGSGSTTGVIAGVNHVVSKCAGSRCVANMSLGGGFSAALNQAVAAAVNAGVVMVVAAGNENTNACSRSPASEPLAITVGSTTNTDARSGFSNWGSCVDIYAPGSAITSSWNTSPTAIATLQGTSMASPHVAGIAAAIRSANPSWNPNQVRNAIVFTYGAKLSFGGSLATVDDIACGILPPCGGGNRGNGVCTDGTCCSVYGWCGTTPAHCGSAGATCGGGNRGNGICADGTCCSKWGWCGTTPAHCAG